jgi:hypothetical protein
MLFEWTTLFCSSIYCSTAMVLLDPTLPLSSQKTSARITSGTPRRHCSPERGFKTTQKLLLSHVPHPTLSSFAAISINAAPVHPARQLNSSSSIDCSSANPLSNHICSSFNAFPAGTAVMWAVALNNTAAFELLAAHPLTDVSHAPVRIKAPPHSAPPSI